MPELELLLSRREGGRERERERSEEDGGSNVKEKRGQRVIQVLRVVLLSHDDRLVTRISNNDNKMRSEKEEGILLSHSYYPTNHTCNETMTLEGMTRMIRT